MIPRFLQNHLKDITNDGIHVSARLVSSTGNDQLEILFYGSLIEYNGTQYITSGELPCLIVARDSISGEEITVFDQNRHGYDAMFCNTPQSDLDRPLQRYDAPAGPISVTFEYSIDLEEDFTCDDGMIMLADGTQMELEEAQSLAWGWIWMRFTDSGKEFLDMELA